MSTRHGRALLSVAAPLLILLLPVDVYLVDHAFHREAIPRNVWIGEVDVGGLQPDEARSVVSAYRDRLAAEPAIFTVNGTRFELDPRTVGFDVDVEGAVRMATDRGGHGLVDGLFPWMRSFSTKTGIPLTVTVEEHAVDAILGRWEGTAIDEPAFDGEIRVIDGAVEIHYPKAGLRIDRDAAGTLIEQTLTTGERSEVAIPLIDRPPVITKADLDAAAARVEDLIDGPVRLTDPGSGATYTMTARELANAVSVDIVTGDDPRVDVGLDPQTVASIFEPHREEYEQPPVEVKIDTNVATDDVSITMPENGTRVDTDALVAALEKAASGSNRGVLPITDDVEPEITAEEVRAWGPIVRVSDFTTRTPGKNRVHNIHLMADTVDGSIVWPGETFSINETVGRRTEAKGYLRDAAIIDGEVYCCDSPTNVGGGVSQFGTTFFNAVFFGGYEDVEHRPHSIYFKKYPEGREATLGYPHPDVVFRNNTDAPVIIRTAYTSSTITVKFFGNNGGIKVTSERSDRSNFTEPRVIYEENPALAPGVQRVVKNGTRGWSVTVTRVITHPDGTVTRERFPWKYRGSARKIQVASCVTLPGSTHCSKPPTMTAPPVTKPPTTTTPPSTTTTTTPPSTTTTTTPPSTTTTTTPPSTTTTGP